MTDEKDRLILEMSERIEALEKKEERRVSTPWGVFDKDTFNTFFWIGAGVMLLATIGVIFVVTSDDPFILLGRGD